MIEAIQNEPVLFIEKSRDMMISWLCAELRRTEQELALALLFMLPSAHYKGVGVRIATGVLTWNTNGSLQKLVITDQINSANSQTCNYTHDDLGRTASANCGTTVFNQNFA